jgi:hypothetical protein
MGKKAQIKRAKKAAVKQTITMHHIDNYGFLPLGALGDAMIRRLLNRDAGTPVGDGKRCVILFDDDSLDHASTVVSKVFGDPAFFMHDYQAWVQKRAIDATLADQRTLVRGAKYPLHVAAAQGLTGLAEMLLDKGADPNQPVAWSAYEMPVTPLEIAAEGIVLPEVALRTIELLLSKGAKVTQLAIDLLAQKGFGAVKALVEKHMLGGCVAVAPTPFRRMYAL